MTHYNFERVLKNAPLNLAARPETQPVLGRNAFVSVYAGKRPDNLPKLNFNKSASLWLSEYNYVHLFYEPAEKIIGVKRVINADLTCFRVHYYRKNLVRIGFIQLLNQYQLDVTEFTGRHPVEIFDEDNYGVIRDRMLIHLGRKYDNN